MYSSWMNDSAVWKAKSTLISPLRREKKKSLCMISRISDSDVGKVDDNDDDDDEVLSEDEDEVEGALLLLLLEATGVDGTDDVGSVNAADAAWCGREGCEGEETGGDWSEGEL